MTVHRRGTRLEQRVVTDEERRHLIEFLSEMTGGADESGLTQGEVDALVRVVRYAEHLDAKPLFEGSSERH